jgi:hypothetical protein
MWVLFQYFSPLIVSKNEHCTGDWGDDELVGFASRRQGSTKNFIYAYRF